MKGLEGLRWRQAWVAHLGCIEGCLDYLGITVTRPWLYGGTGHAFVANISEVLCESGPTAWNTSMLFDLAPNLGYRAQGLSVWRSEAGEAFPDKQREAWEFVRATIDRNLPCYGWQLEVPDYYVIYGYDDVGYYYSGWGCDDGKGPLPWQKLATWDVDLLEVFSVEPCEPAPDGKAVKDALTMALKHAGNPSDWIHSGYRSGPGGFDLWAEALEAGRAMRDGHAYNAAVWHECRAMAVEFLREARQRLPGRCDDAFDEATGHYTVARDRLAAVASLHPMRDDADWQTTFESGKSAGLIREAAAEERQGLASLEHIVAALQ